MKKLTDMIKDFIRKFGIEVHRSYSNKSWYLHQDLRASTRELRNYYERPLIGVEIGVLEGEHAEKLIQHTKTQKLYLIDPYLEYENYYDKETPDARTQDSMNNAKEEAHNKLDKYDQCDLVWIEELSDEAIKRIQEKFDYVYIDGNHSYEYVKADIQNYSKLLRSDGLLSGHDLNIQDVLRAVLEFSKEHNCVFQAGVGGKGVDWYIFMEDIDV